MLVLFCNLSVTNLYPFPLMFYYHPRIRFCLARKQLFSIMRVPDLVSRPLLIMANKQDQPGAMRADEVRDLFQSIENALLAVRIYNLFLTTFDDKIMKAWELDSSTDSSDPPLTIGNRKEEQANNLTSSPVMGYSISLPTEPFRGRYAFHACHLFCFSAASPLSLLLCIYILE